MSKVIVVRSNSLLYDPRVRKISKSLNKKYPILVLGWNREGLSKEETDNFLANYELFGLRAPFGRPSLLLYLPLFWIWVFSKLVKNLPGVVHACDLDLVLPCYMYKLIFRKKLVFDVFDRYAMTYVSPKHKKLYSLVNSLEDFFSGKSDVLVNVSERLLSTFRKRPSRCPIIMNCAEDHSIARVRSKNNNLKIFHSGGIKRTRGLEQLATSINDLDNVELVIAGRIQHDDLKQEILAFPNVKYMGILSTDELLVMEADCDVSVAFYDLKDPINEYSMGNKLFEAMMLGLPIITNVAPEIINEVGNGFVVDYNDIKVLKRTIINLRDNVVLREQMGNNGRSAFLQKYNWASMEQELYKFYDDLMANRP